MNTKKWEFVANKFANQVRAANDQVISGHRQIEDVWKDITRFFQEAEANIDLIKDNRDKEVEIEEIIYKHLMFITGDYQCRLCGKPLFHGTKAYGYLVGEKKFEVECLECGSKAPE